MICCERSKLRQYSIVLIALLGLLLLQFALGMFANLFYKFPPPPAHPEQGLAVALAILSSGLPVVVVHATNGLVMLALAALALALARRAHQRYLFGLALIGFFAIIVSADSGYHLVYSGWIDNLYSYTMSLGFISAFAANLIAFSLVLRAQIPTTNDNERQLVVEDLKP